MCIMCCRNGVHQSTNTCSSGCSCEIEWFEPVCGADGLTYFSPCYAGCHNLLRDTVSYFTLLQIYRKIIKLNWLLFNIFSVWPNWNYNEPYNHSSFPDTLPRHGPQAFTGGLPSLGSLRCRPQMKIPCAPCWKGDSGRQEERIKRLPFQFTQFNDSLDTKA